MQHKLIYPTEMKQTKDCPICEEELFSGLGKGCMLCGMLLEDDQDNFCCEDCEDKYGDIHSN